MRRVLAISLALLAVAALPAAAADGRNVKGVVTAISASAISVRDAHGAVLTCRVAATSPRLTGYSVGDTVQAGCLGRRGKLVLARLRHVASPDGSADEGAPVTFAGAVTALTATSVALHDGDRDLTCTLDASSPALTGVVVGRHIRVLCKGGVLVSWQPVTAPPAPTPAPQPTPAPGGDAGHATVTAAGLLTVVSATALTIHNDEHGDVGCGLGPTSPPLGDFHVGDRVAIVCVGGVLAKIAHLSNK